MRMEREDEYDDDDDESKNKHVCMYVVCYLIHSSNVRMVEAVLHILSSNKTFHWSRSFLPYPGVNL